MKRFFLLFALLPLASSCFGSADGAVLEGSLELPAVESNDLLIEHSGYVVSYDRSALIPEWVAYELTADELEGYVDRDEMMFRMDPDIHIRQAMREDYSDSGWTKGHMACAADFHWDSDAMAETFYLTNICPQKEELNVGDWNYLEKKVRSWAKKYGKVWVVCGPIVGSGKYGKIGERGVTVPDAFFKAVLREKNGEYQAIAFVMGNDTKRYYLEKCAMSVNKLEDRIGIDLFPGLDDSVEESVEDRVNLREWGIDYRR